MAKERFKLVVVPHLILMKDDQVLLTRRYNTGYEDGKYGLVAGHLDGNETVTAAMIRETKEETGIDIKPEDLEVVHAMHRKSGREDIDFFYICKKWTGTPEILEPNKCDDLSWHSLDHLPENTLAYITFALNQYQKGSIYSEFGWD
jgi:8-oxo-dGTP diphosphatase